MENQYNSLQTSGNCENKYSETKQCCQSPELMLPFQARSPRTALLGKEGEEWVRGRLRTTQGGGGGCDAGVPQSQTSL